MGAAPVERQRVEPARPLTPRRHPAGVEQRLQMPADGGLRELNDVAKLGYGEFPAFKDGEHANAYRVGKDSELINDGRIHPFNRMKEYIWMEAKSIRKIWKRTSA